MCSTTLVARSVRRAPGTLNKQKDLLSVSEIITLNLHKHTSPEVFEIHSMKRTSVILWDQYNTLRTYGAEHENEVCDGNGYQQWSQIHRIIVMRWIGAQLMYTWNSMPVCYLANIETVLPNTYRQRRSFGKGANCGPTRL
jgi:hypothetical protein